MVSSKEKKFIQMQMSKVNQKDQDLNSPSYKSLPRFIVYKAALLREKLLLNYMLMIVTAIFGIYFIVSRVEIYNLYSQLRKKEFILAPGVQDFTPVSPQSVPDSYVHDAVTDFVSSLGNVNSSNITEEYDGLKRFMSDEFKIKFSAESKQWIEQVLDEDLAQITKIKSKKIVSDENGNYQVTVFVRADFYVANQYIGHEDQVVEMKLALIHPERKRRWYIQINDLVWSKLDSFKTKTNFKKH